MRASLPTVASACVRVYTPAYTPMARTVRAAARVRRLLPRAERRDALLRAAARAFARAGFVHTSMEEIAAAAGITKLIIYRHFDSKEALYRAVLQGAFDCLASQLRRGPEAGGYGVGAYVLLAVARADEAGFRRGAPEGLIAPPHAALRMASQWPRARRGSDAVSPPSPAERVPLMSGLQAVAPTKFSPFFSSLDRSAASNDQGPGPDIRRKMQLMICAYSDRISCKTAQMPTWGGTGGGGSGKVPRKSRGLVESIATSISMMTGIE